KIPFITREEEQAENLRKLLIAMADDIRVIIIKLADRLHNMRTIAPRSERSRRENSLETLEVYAPIAHRLGIRAIKEELEDLAISYLDPVAYAEIEEQLSQNAEYRRSFLEKIKIRIEERVKDNLPNVYIEGRVKSIHGIYRKMYMQGKAFDEIYDIYALRIIVDTVTDCYNALGVIHDMYRAIPGRFKDYISTPKKNMYQSLHSTLLSREGIPFEVQIRTWEMHQTAEYGIAAHWKYKEGISKNDMKNEERLKWIRQLLESQNDTDDFDDIVRTIKTDLSQDDVFAMTPKGDVVSLPTGSTVIDFAYAIHSAVGNKMVGAKADGRIVPLEHEIKTGEVVEILTTGQDARGPNRNWLKFVKTSEARSKIRSWFKKEKRPENIAEGKRELEKELKRNFIVLPEPQMSEFILATAERQHFQNPDDFYAAIGYGGIAIPKLLPRMKEEYQKLVRQKPDLDISDLQTAPAQVKNSASGGVFVEGIDNCLVKLSRCCNPLPGDDIIGFITRGHGVSLHKRDCVNVPADTLQAEEPDRWVNAHWASVQKKDTFKSTVQILAYDRSGLLADISSVITGMRVMIHSVNGRELKNSVYQATITVSIESLEHFNLLINRLMQIDSVISVKRSGL
ncbi:MAG: bifunctional (p)ppGpp synthetase/guanosine-3',5'-bis(diphosphate) 3'-pyrophosphohydrolase, partial [Oscillospiraceae bacterium]|nr:bifunctional (p)ppGpp synthetase/guanosine-3',5'-bis(diphosphate) 3'-pyrophosphohydrolase [Oscillospiraceae bacterium]